MFKLITLIHLLIILALHPGISFAQEDNIVPGVSTISISDARQSAIAFVNSNTSPGLEGATLELNEEGRQSTNWRSSLGFNAEFTLRNYIFDGYWGLAVVGGELKDDIDLIGDQGETVKLNLRRQVVALRGSFGLSFPIDQHFKLRPYLSLVASELRTNFSYENLSDPLLSGSRSTSAWMYSTVGTIEAIYFQWYGQYKLELDAFYHLIYTDSFSEDNPILATYDWNDSIKLEANFSGATKLNTQGRPWRWHIYGNYINFLSHNESALGYTQLIEVGAGLNWQMNIKPLDWFGWQSLGIRIGFIYGEDVEGYNFGLTAQ
ncbi:hypothetical protein [Kaarinaea lacus]